VRDRDAELGHDRVADELVEHAALLRDAVHHEGEILVEQGDGALGAELLGERGEGADVGKKHRGLDALAAEQQALVTSARLDCAALADLASPVRSRVLRAWLITQGATEVTAQHLAAVTALVTAWRGQRWVELPGLRVRREDAALVSIHG